ncbi:MAG: ABC transporter ATP-binding protein/permease, partial [Rickettsiales bacterium]|nr:ABC transporter ATP-binding protein/permease [Rickettsiales bacterium]
VRNIGRRAKAIQKDAQQRVSDFVGKIGESFANIKVIKSYGMERYESGYIGGILDDMFKIGMSGVRNSASVAPVIESMSGLIMAGIVVFGGWQVSEGTLTTGGFVTFLGAWVSVYKPLKSLINFRVHLQQAMVSAERVYEIIDTKPAIADAAGAVALGRAAGEIEFRNVSFGYDPGRPVLSNLSIRIPRGATVALVGASGAGKTTVVNLIPRFFDPDGGAVLVDGRDIRTVTQKSLRENISLVTQDVMLFDDTVRNNIAYGRGFAEGRRVDMEDIVAAAKSANADKFIMGLKDGYETRVGERGVNLSGGQKQRISIARAIIKDAPILLLDEATSALDAESEHEVQKALDNLMKDRTTVVIAHRLSTIVGADMICVMEAGRVVESGTHAELLEKGGAYARLYGMQFKDGK